MAKQQTHHEIPQDDNETRLQLIIPKFGRVVKEFRLNREWFLGTIAAYLGYTLLFALAAFWLENNWSFWRALYFTVLSTLTGGYGDLTLTTAGKVLLCINSFAGLVLLGLILTVIAMSLQVDEAVTVEALAQNKPETKKRAGDAVKIEKTPEESKIKAAEGIVALIDFIGGDKKSETLKSGEIEVVIKHSDDDARRDYRRIDFHIRVFR